MPHPLTSAEADRWTAFAELMANNLDRFALMPAKPGDPKLTPEECCRLMELAVAVRAFHMGCLTFDAEVEAQRAKFEAGAHTCGG
jgi:hypothetical protein